MKFAKFLVFFFLSTALAHANDLEIKIQEAVNLDATGQSQKAKDLLLANMSQSSAQENQVLLFNLGVVSTKLNQMGEAFVYFTGALWANPFFSEAREARKITASKLAPAQLTTRPQTWFLWIHDDLRFFSWQPWFVLALIFSAIFLRYYPRSGQLETWHWGTIGIFLFSLGMGCLLALESRQSVAGIIQNTKVLSGPDRTFPEITSIAPGSLVNVEEKKSTWLKIRYQNTGKKEAVGWIESPTALIFSND